MIYLERFKYPKPRAVKKEVNAKIEKIIKLDKKRKVRMLPSLIPISRQQS
jgi:hypothetical protein